MELNELNKQINSLIEKRKELEKEKYQEEIQEILSFKWCFGKEARLEINQFWSPYSPKYKLEIKTISPKISALNKRAFKVFGEVDGANYLDSINFYYEEIKWPWFGTNNGKLLCEFFPLLKLKSVEYDRDLLEVIRTVDLL